ncbi:transcription repressor NadR [Fuchsiella alkaliacetigena]|uniref:transcription repressor NadR n=1 Tax=Fuchsiella alkaliacetigena TaxID=957042 RepID=UPI00200AC1E5|nr:transcription repressor NadR [Fuchsiella alkaliacetigena]MCK8823906.1 transcription repressor NadR [Fuchsiella alkaliacetigena]
MSTDKRREDILKVLSLQEEPITGSDLAEQFGVSRQVIVQDIALLRAQGKQILATSQGYILAEPGQQRASKTIACVHGPEESEIAEELEIIVQHGGRIRDVIVEHPLYGELKGLLMIQSKSDIKEFIKKYRQETVKPLLTLTEGVHLHTVEALTEEGLMLIEEKLAAVGYLLS